MMDYVKWPDGFHVAEVPGHPGFLGYGNYEEEYLLHDGERRISCLRLSRLRIDALPFHHPPPLAGRLRMSAGWI